MTYELAGELAEIFDTEKISDRFQKREFVVKTEESNGDQTFTDYIKFQLTQNKCDIIDGYKPGDQVRVTFGIKGNRWEKNGKVNFFTNLNAWRIEKTTAGAPDDSSFSDEGADDIPFFPDSDGDDQMPF